MEMTLFWDVVPCIQVKSAYVPKVHVVSNTRGITLVIEAASTTEMSVPDYMV
jgi:hypothetical protein